jgi:DNA-binding CsgD family transcriptional regulator
MKIIRIKKNTIRRHEALILKLQGLTYRDIGKKLNISGQRVQQILSPPAYIRNLVCQKADGKCQVCGKFVGDSGDVHHNGYDFENYDEVQNLTLLCISCHRKAHALPEVLKELKASEKASITAQRSYKTYDRNIQVVNLYSKGERVCDIAQQFKISETRVYNILHRVKNQH